MFMTDKRKEFLCLHFEFLNDTTLFSKLRNIVYKRYSWEFDSVVQIFILEWKFEGTNRRSVKLKKWSTEHTNIINIYA